MAKIMEFGSNAAALQKARVTFGAAHQRRASEAIAADPRRPPQYTPELASLLFEVRRGDRPTS
jgi:hypothetical protein